MSTVSKIADYLRSRTGTDPRNVQIDLMEKKINDINIRLETAERFLVALQNPERRGKDSLKKKNLFPDNLFTIEITQIINLIKGLNGVVSSESYDTLQNKFSDVLQSHEMFKYHLNNYRSANMNEAEAKLNICEDYRDNEFYVVITEFLYFLKDFKKKEIQELNDKILNLKNEIIVNSEKKAA